MKEDETELVKAIKRHEENCQHKLSHREKQAFIAGWYERYATIYGV